MILSVGNKVVYPNQGPCRIGEVVEKMIGGRPTSFYQLALLDESGDALFVPLDKIRTLGIRQLMAKSEIPKLLSHLKKATVPEKNWKQRAIDNARLLSSGSAFDLAEIVESLTELNEIRALPPRDRQILDRAKKILVCEISEVTGESKSAVVEQIDEALKMRHRE